MILPDAILDALADPRCRLTYGVVVTVEPLTVIVGASTVASTAVALNSYGPGVGDYVAVLVQGEDRLVIGAIGGSAGMGLRGQAQLAADQTVTAAGGVTDITGVSVTWEANPNRWYRTTLQIGAADHTVANGTETAYITDAANALKRNASATGTTSTRNSYYLSIDETGLSGSTTRKARFATSGGSVILTATGAATFAPLLYVEDIGPA
jgi:hypothetical protein